MENKLYHGAAYYPELWEDKIMEDINLMKETGINLARIGEFAWSRMEPEEGKVDISFFVDVVKKLYENGIETIMCTPTPTPPIWMSHGHPERMYVDDQGNTMNHGSRQHICTNNGYFREKAHRITNEIAKHIGELPGLVGWQLDNEMKCHVSECMCKTCKELWHQWLEKEYGNIDDLNEAWGAKIWSEEYLSFDQVPQPLHVPFLHNASHSSAYRRFSRESTSEFLKDQANVIRAYSKAPITHNSCFAFDIDNEAIMEDLDFASVDGYPVYDNYQSFIMKYDFWRNLKKGKNFWVMETSPSHAGSLASYAKVHPNGYLVAEAVAAYALGAQGFCYWLWRQQRSGCEQPHSSVISAWGDPGVGYPNVLALEKARQVIEPIFTKTKAQQAELAITYSDMAKVFILSEPHRDLDYRAGVTKFHELILETGIHRDLIIEKDTLEGYKLLLTPFMHYLSPEYIANAKAFVEKGGIWIVGPMTGGRTKEHTIHTDAALGDLDALAGVKTLATYPMDDSGAQGEAFGVRATLGLWSAVFEGKEAKMVGKVVGGVTPDTAFITERALGSGKIIMLGSMPIEDQGDLMIKALVEHYAREAGIETRTDVAIGTIVAPRIGDGYRLWVIINMDGKGGHVTSDQAGVDLLTGEPVAAGKIEVGKYAYKIIKFN